jgi:hypothetical protein
MIGGATKTSHELATELTSPLVLFVAFGAMYGLIGAGLNDYLAVWDEQPAAPAANRPEHTQDGTTAPPERGQYSTE